MIFASKKESLAHQRSKFAVIDPLYNSSRKLPEPDCRYGAAPWLYGYGELECWRLQQLRLRVKDAGLKIGYPGEFHLPSERVWFRHRFAGGAEFTFRATEETTVRLDSRVIFRSCRISGDSRAEWLILELSTVPGKLPGLLVEEGVYNTAQGNWEWSADGIRWEEPASFPQTASGVEPHRVELSETVLAPESRDGKFWDFGRELFGKVVIRCHEKPEIGVGESPEEAWNRIDDDKEQTLEVAAVAKDVWESSVPLAFRYLRVDSPETVEVACKAMFYPSCYRGAFACSNSELTRIWSNCAYTLRLCMQDFLLDGIKRDRLPWVGDLMMSLMVNAYTFADAEIVRRSLTALGRAGIARTHLNGIIDYSLWWVICHDCFQLYFGDRKFLRREWERIVALMTNLEARCDVNGTLTLSSGDWLFFDWKDCEKLTALQVLWFWALKAGAKLAARLGKREHEDRWTCHAGTVEAFLQKNAWDEEKQCWMGIPGDSASTPSRYAQFLSVLSGLAKPEQQKAIRAHLLGHELPPVGTPYMAGFENLALAELDALDKLVERVEDYWGGMLKRGATTFWEAYDPAEQGKAAYVFYNRPFGKSLCHAWSAGPAAFLPIGLLRLKPLADGWTEFSLEPVPGLFNWIAVTVSTPHGELEIIQEGNKLSLHLPPGVTAICGKRKLQGNAVIKSSRAELVTI